MKARKWLWWVLVPTCACVAVIASLARPYDPYAAFRRLGATEDSGWTMLTASETEPGHIKPSRDDRNPIRIFHFTAPVSRVEALLPKHSTSGGSNIDEFTLPNGDEGILVKPTTDPTYPFLGPGDTCIVQITESTQNSPWYLQAWRALRYRLGF